MNNKVDKLFKEKLETHTLQPSAQAWEKVESHLSKKNKMVVWVRVAAAITLLGALTFVVLNMNVDSNPEQKKEVVKKEETPTATPETHVAPQVKQEVAVVPDITPAKKNTRPVAPAVDEPKQEPVTVITEPEPEPVVATIETPAKVEKGITLTYSLPAIKKQEPVATDEPVVAEAKKTGLERVLEIAKEVKNADNPLGGLRDAKDEILAFEFRKDKNKKN